MAQRALTRRTISAPEARRPAVAATTRPMLVQRLAETPARGIAAEPSGLVRSALAAPGERLDAGTRAFMEPRFGHDFSQVRVHADASAAEAAGALNARAFTVGDHIFFGAGQSAAGGSGRRLVAHELTHVTQQRAGAVSGVPGPGGLTVSEPGDAFERSAERMADAVMAGRGVARPGPAAWAAPAAPGAPVVQRFLAGDDGHGKATKDAMTAAGYSEEEREQAYYGNWLRDYSQVVYAEAGRNDLKHEFLLWFAETVAMGEFGRMPTREELGRYLPSEHMDNPEGGDSAENPGYYYSPDKPDASGKAFDPVAAAKAQQAQRVKGLSKSQQAWLADTQEKFSSGPEKGRVDDASKDAIEQRSYLSGLPDYIERGKVHAIRQIELAASLGRNRDGLAALDNGGHAIQDYFAHSNFVEVALDLLVNNDRYGHAVAANNASYLATQRYPGVKWDDLGRLNGDRRIVTGTSAPGPADDVGAAEIDKTQNRSGELSYLFAKGLRVRYFDRYVLNPAEKGARAATHTLGEGVGGAIGAVGGAVGGLVAGAGRGAAEGWRKEGHWWRKPLAAIGGLFKGAVTGAGAGAKAGARAGARVGGKVGDVFGNLLAPIIGAVGKVAMFPAEMVVFLLARAKFLLGAIHANKHIREATEKTYKGPGKTQGLTHSQIAKDDPDHPLHAAAFDLAEFVEYRLYKKMAEVWAHKAGVKEATDLVDFYIAHPAKSDWWKARLAAFVNKSKADGPAK